MNDLHTCPKCGVANFTARGLIAHQPYCQGELDDLDVSPTTVIAVNPVNPVNPVKPSGKTTRMDSQAQLAPISLASIAATANEAIEIISRHEAAFEHATLNHRLIIGQQMAIAQDAFGLSIEDKLSEARQMASAIRSGLAAEAAELERTGGFGGWLALNCPKLPRQTAQKYATAYRGLGLPLDASKDEIFLRVDDIRNGRADGLPDRTAELAAAKAAAIAAAAESEPTRPGTSAYTTAITTQQKAAGMAAPLTLADLVRAGKPTREQEMKTLREGSKKAPCFDPEIRRQDAREFFGIHFEEACKRSIDRGLLDALDKPGLERLKNFNLWLRDRINNRLKSFGE